MWQFRPGPLSVEAAEVLNRLMVDMERRVNIASVVAPLQVQSECLFLQDQGPALVKKTGSTADADGYFDGSVYVYDVAAKNLRAPSPVKVLDLSALSADLGEYVGIQSGHLPIYAVGAGGGGGGAANTIIVENLDASQLGTVGKLLLDQTTGLRVLSIDTAASPVTAHLQVDPATVGGAGVITTGAQTVTGNKSVQATYNVPVIPQGGTNTITLACNTRIGAGSLLSGYLQVRSQTTSGSGAGSDSSMYLAPTQIILSAPNWVPDANGNITSISGPGVSSLFGGVSLLPSFADSVPRRATVRYTSPNLDFVLDTAGSGQAARFVINDISGSHPGGTNSTGGLVFVGGLYISGSITGGGGPIQALDEGTSLTTAATSFNFVGAGVTATVTGSAVTVTIPGGGGGTVTSVAASGGTTGLTFTGSPITTSGTLTLGGTLALSAGGTGQTTAPAALNALLPSQSGQSGKFLKTDGSNPSWASTGAVWTVTSVAANFTAGTTPTSYYCSSATATITATLPPVAGNSGLRLQFTKTSASSATNLVTVKGNASETINSDLGATNTIDLYYQLDSITVECDGSAWWVVADKRRCHVCVAVRSATQVLAHATMTTISLDTAAVDGLGMFAGSSINIKRAGRYALAAYWSMQGTNVQLQIVKPGPTLFLTYVVTNASGVSYLANTIYGVRTLAAGDQFYLQGYAGGTGAAQGTYTGTEQPVLSISEIR